MNHCPLILGLMLALAGPASPVAFGADAAPEREQAQEQDQEQEQEQGQGTGQDVTPATSQQTAENEPEQPQAPAGAGQEQANVDDQSHNEAQPLLNQPRQSAQPDRSAGPGESRRRENGGERRDRQAQPPSAGRGRDAQRPDPRQGRSDRPRSPRTERAPAVNRENNRDLAQFKIITERNIFDATRSARTARTGPERPRPTRSESITLVGTMTYEKGAYAFFDGSSSDFRKVLEIGKSIANHKIVAIHPHSVTLQMATNQFELQIGGQLRHAENGWEPVISAAPAATTTTATTSAAGDSTSGGAEDEILKRLMRQREEELK
jgi:type II secretory pathway pseudopilin PulG